MTKTAGVIAVQGDVSEHVHAIERAAANHAVDVDVVTVRESGIVPACDYLAIPGGESTTISRLLFQEGIAAEILTHVANDKPVLATCAGLIVAATSANDDRVQTLGILDVTVNRNAFGRQKDSFESTVDIRGISDPFPAVFIRAPVISEVGSGVTVLGTFQEQIVAVYEPPVVGTAFHPELTPDTSIHELAFFEQPLDTKSLSA
jgi:5'-phosphate synthase pdxT subunit